MTLFSSIKAGGIRPVKIEKNKLYLLNSGDAVYKEIILAEKHIIEEIIKQITNIDITLKGFTAEPSQISSEQNDLTTGKVKDKSKESTDEDFCQSVVDFFGENMVTFKD